MHTGLYHTLSFSVWTLLPIHCSRRGLLLHLITLNDTHSVVHTQWHTLGNPPLDEWLARCKGLYLNNTQHSQERNTYVPAGIRTRNPSRRAAADPRLRLRGHRDRLMLYSLGLNWWSSPVNACNLNFEKFFVIVLFNDAADYDDYTESVKDERVRMGHRGHDINRWKNEVLEQERSQCHCCHHRVLKDTRSLQQERPEDVCVIFKRKSKYQQARPDDGRVVCVHLTE
jgi:hypothetical protein